MPDGLHVFYYLSLKIPSVLKNIIFCRKGRVSKSECDLEFKL